MRAKKTVTKEEMLLKMADLCARSEQCAFDIATKLRLKGLSASDISDVISSLTERKFIDDYRFARSFARDKVRFSAWGRRKIRLALAAKRIPSSVISDALLEIDDADYRDALSRCARSKAASLDLSNYEDRLRLYRYLASRGFESELASAEVKRWRLAQESE